MAEVMRIVQQMLLVLWGAAPEEETAPRVLIERRRRPRGAGWA
jgi:hypothetical protein